MFLPRPSRNLRENDCGKKGFPSILPEAVTTSRGILVEGPVSAVGGPKSKKQNCGPTDQ